MPSAVLCLTVVCALLLSLTDASTQLREIGAWAPQASATTSWPRLRFDVKMKGNAKVFGQSEPLLYARPILSNNGNSVVYSVFAFFSEKFTSPTFKTVETNYIVVDGIAFTTNISTADSFKSRSFECLISEAGNLNLPPVNGIVQGIMSATPVPVSDRIGQCPGGQYSVFVNDDKFELCRVSDQMFTMTGRDMDIVVETTDPAIMHPSNFSQGSVCPQVVKSVTVTQTGKMVLTELKQTFRPES